MEIIEPNWYDLDCLPSMGPKKARIWFKENVEPINKLLAEGVEVYADKFEEDKPIYFKDRAGEGQKALLINLQPIKAETAEDVLRDAIEFLDPHSDSEAKPDYNHELFKRAKAVLKEQT